MNKVCRKCGSSFEQIMQNGFAGCEYCYEISQLRTAIDKLFDGKKHKGRIVGDDYEI